MSILAALLVVLSFVSFTLPASNHQFAGFANAITTDIDLKGGYSGEYKISFNEETIKGSESVDEAKKFIQQKFAAYGYGTTTVVTSGIETLRIEIPQIKYAESMLMAVGTEGDLYIRTSETTEVSDTDITGREVKDIYSTFAQVTATEFKWGTTIEFNEDGQEKIESLTESGNGTIYVYVGEEVFSRISFSQQVTGNSLYVYGSAQDQDSANVYAFTMLMGKLGVNFDLIGDDIVEIPPVDGNNAILTAALAIAILLVLIVCVSFTLFGDFGWIFMLSLVFYATIVLFFMQAIPVFALSVGGVVGTILGLVLLFFSNYIIFNNIKKGYAEGKKIPLAVRAGFKKSIMTVVDMNVIAMIIAVVCIIAGGALLQSFAFALLISGALNLFVSLLLNRWFVKWYLNINSKDATRLRMKREANVDEI